MSFNTRRLRNTNKNDRLWINKVEGGVSVSKTIIEGAHNLVMNAQCRNVIVRQHEQSYSVTSLTHSKQASSKFYQCRLRFKVTDSGVGVVDFVCSCKSK